MKSIENDKTQRTTLLDDKISRIRINLHKAILIIQQEHKTLSNKLKSKSFVARTPLEMIDLMYIYIEQLNTMSIRLHESLKCLEM
jgi:hypothetical protein